jgi:hypothetical protein
MKEYEERQAAKEEEKKKKQESPKSGSALNAKPEAGVEEEPAAVEEKKESAMPFGAAMMSGMMPGVKGGKPAEEKKPMLPVTVWGRYAKILLSSTEFTFIN